jgi:cation diffusion facilitator CzcD-associated flavoprotein CzcO
MPNAQTPREVDVLILGAGVCGIAAAVGCRKAGIDDFLIVDRAGEVGGTWHHNRYPGCAVDIPSHLYSFSYEPNPDWSRIYSPAAEVKCYLESVVDKFSLGAQMALKTELLDATWMNESQRWDVTTSAGNFHARAFVSAAGPLHEAIIPNLPGLATFEGEMFHSSAWPDEDNLDGKNVVVIGTGASAIQFVPQIQPRVASMTVLQRTPSWVLPKPDWAVSRLQQSLLRRIPALARLLRWAMWAAMDVLMLAATRNQQFARSLGVVHKWHLRRAVECITTQRALTPDYAPTCKRLGFSNDYFSAFAHDNVKLVTESAAAVTANAVVTAEGHKIPADVIIFGTGFQTLQHHPINSRIHGRDGLSLEDVWNGSPTAYLGTTVAGFPNAFVMFGPNVGTLSGFVMAEAQTGYLIGALKAMKKMGLTAIEVRQEDQNEFTEKADRILKGSTWVRGGCSSYYLDETGRAALPWPKSMLSLHRALKKFDLHAYHAVPAPNPVIEVASS